MNSGPSPDRDIVVGKILDEVLKEFPNRALKFLRGDLEVWKIISKSVNSARRPDAGEKDTWTESEVLKELREKKEDVGRVIFRRVKKIAERKEPSKEGFDRFSKEDFEEFSIEDWEADSDEYSEGYLKKLLKELPDIEKEYKRLTFLLSDYCKHDFILLSRTHA